MDHRYIDDHSVADRYLAHTLAAPERKDFEAHLVDCQECTDRLLLAEMFHHRNGHPQRNGSPPANEPETLRVRFVRLFTSWQIFLIMAVAAAALVLLTCSLLLAAARRYL
jgi:hypothetical protein